MKVSMRIPVSMLGQSGCRLDFGGTIVYVDPYLSNSVQLLDAPDLERRVPLTLKPEEVRDAEWVLLTHAHIDHCDPHTIPALARASPTARFIGPEPVLKELREWDVAESRLELALEDWQPLAEGLTQHADRYAHRDFHEDKLNSLR